MIESLLIGLSTSASCLASCGNIILSIIMAEHKSISKSFVMLGCFMAGRLLIYSAIATITSLLTSIAYISPKITAINLLVLGILMLMYSIGKTKQICLNHKFTRRIYKICQGQINIISFAAGFLSAVNICPPIISLIGNAISTKEVFASFALFFIGSSVFFLPLPLAGAIKNKSAVTKIGKSAAVLAGWVFIMKGLTIIIS